jgi:MoxR-like ATPase
MIPTFDINTVPEADRARVAALIPSPVIAEAYVHRNIGAIEDFDLLDLAVEERENVILSGPTGSSKTTLFRAYAAARGLPFCVVECSGGLDVGMVMGRTTIGPDGAVQWIDGELTLVVRYGGVSIIDELNLAHPRITAGFHQLLAVTRRMSIPEAGETVVAGRGGTGAPQPTLFAAAYNPRYQGTTRINEAMGNRFAIHLDWDYERSVEEQLVTSTRLLDMAENIRSLAEIRTPLSTNALMEFERHALRMGMDLARRLLVNRFAPEERAPVARALEANLWAIATELELDPEETEAGLPA